MSKEEEILSAEFWVVENYNMEESDVISFEMMNAYAEYLHQSRVNAKIHEFKKILEDESDCKGIYLTKGTIRGSDALDAFAIWIKKLLKQ